MNWPATCLARTKLDNYYCVRTHCVGLTLLNCYPTFLLRKKELEQARQPYLFCTRKKQYICVAKPRVMIDVSTLSENGLPQRHVVGTFDVCLARPKKCPADIVRAHAAQLSILTWCGLALSQSTVDVKRNVLFEWSDLLTTRASEHMFSLFLWSGQFTSFCIVNWRKFSFVLASQILLTNC